MKVDLEKAMDVAKQIPVGSKVRLLAIHAAYCGKIIGYHEDGGYVLIYNPEIAAHSGYDVVVNDIGVPLSSEYLVKKYGEHMFYYPVEDVTILMKPL